MSDEDIFWDDGIPPPRLQKGSKLFINNDERTNFDKAGGYAYFGFKKQSFLGYALEYIQAANKLIQTIDDLPGREAYVLPIVFLYRHYIELQLKSILEQEGCEILPRHHLDALWTQVKPILERVFRQLSKKELLAEMEAVEERIIEFHEVDERSYSFRYPIDRKGNPSLKNSNYSGVLARLRRKRETGTVEV